MIQNRLIPKNIRSARGFTLVELITTVTISGILMGVGVSAFTKYDRQQRARRAAEAAAWTITVARSNAVRTGTSVSVVVDESNRTVVVRDTSGTVLLQKRFGAGSDNFLNSLTLDTVGDSLIFSRRGFCLNCRQDAPTLLTASAGGRSYNVEIGLLGRAEVKSGG